MRSISLVADESGVGVGVGSSLVWIGRGRDVVGFGWGVELVAGPTALLSSELNASTTPVTPAASRSTPPIAAIGIHGTFLPPCGFEPGGGGGVHAVPPADAPVGGGGGPVNPYCGDTGGE